MFNMITVINESKALTNHISCECWCWFDERNFNSYQWWNNDKCWCEFKNQYVFEKDPWNPATCNCENGKYFASIMVDSAIICDEVIDADAKSNDEAKMIDESNFNEKKSTCNMQISIFCLHVS